MTTRTLWILLVGVLFSASGWAQGVFRSEYPSLNRKVRNLGMGNTGVALKGTGESSPFYNPAGMNDVEDSTFQFFTITGELAKTSEGLFGDLKDFKDELDADKIEDEQAFENFIASHAGNFEHVRFSLDIFSYWRKNFAAGLVLDEKMDLSFRDLAYPNFQIRNFADAAVYASLAHDFLDKAIQVGVTLRPTVRFSLDEADTVVDLSDILEEDSSGDPIFEEQMKNIKDPRFGLGVDVGLKSNLAFGSWKDNSVFKYLAPEIGATWQDMGNTSFASAPGNEQTISTGFAIHPDVWKLENVFSVDFRELNQDQAFLSKVHLGAESWLKLFKWFGVAARAGMNQGYYAAGLTLDFHVVRIDGAFYQEEIGTKTRQDGNTRYAGTLSFKI